MNQHVVVWDPSGKFWDGAIVGQNEAPTFAERGAVTLPCDPELFPAAGFAGFAKRSWGAGWPLDLKVPGHSCPISMFSPGDPYRHLHWAARLVPSRALEAMLENGDSNVQIEGMLRLATWTHRGGTYLANIAELPVPANAVSIAKIGKMDENGGWNVGGRAVLHATGEGTYGMGLYGFAPGMRVVWLAATLTL